MIGRLPVVVPSTVIAPMTSPGIRCATTGSHHFINPSSMQGAGRHHPERGGDRAHLEACAGRPSSRVPLLDAKRPLAKTTSAPYATAGTRGWKSKRPVRRNTRPCETASARCRQHSRHSLRSPTISSRKISDAGSAAGMADREGLMELTCFPAVIRFLSTLPLRPEQKDPCASQLLTQRDGSATPGLRSLT